MYNQMLKDFQDGFGQDTAQNLEELNKALGTGQDGAAYGNGEYNDMSALRPQSLEGTLKIVTAQEKHIKFWKELDKKPAYNTVEEFNVLDSYGGDGSPSGRCGRGDRRRRHGVRAVGVREAYQAAVSCVRLCYGVVYDEAGLAFVSR
jgi:hypothetical protein